MKNIRGCKTWKSAVSRTLPMFAIILTILFLSSTGYAQGINYPVGSPTGTSGTGNARTDPDNLFIRNNIAGLTEVPMTAEEENSGKVNESGNSKLRLSGEFQLSFYSYERVRNFPSALPGGFGAESRANIVAPGAAGEVTYTTGNRKYALAMGTYQLFGFSSKIEDNPADLGPRALFFDARIASNDFAFGGAVRLHKKLSVGASFIFGRAFLDLEAPAASTLLAGSTAISRLDVDAVGAPGANVGIHYRPTEKVSIGLNYKSKRSYDLEGNFSTFAVRPTPTGNQFIPVNPQVRVDIDLPTVLEGGIEIKPNEKIIFAADYRFYDYSDALQLIQIRSQQSGQEIANQAVFAKDVRSIRLGSIFKLSDKTKLQLGFAYTTNGIPAGNVNPGLINTGGSDVSGGLSKKIAGYWFNFGVAGIFGRERKIETARNPIFPGTYRGKGVLFGFGLRL